jgi:hypothetical protein
LLLEQWLDMIEGDPNYLLRGRFMMEESRRMQARRPGAPLYEPRPW